MTERIWDCLTRWRVEPGGVEDIKTAQVIVTQCAELLTDGTAGPGNTLIAEHANWFHDRFKLPIIAQREILVAKPDLEVVGVVDPTNTREVAVAQKKICDERGWKNVLVITFPDHMWRACEVYKKLGLNPIPAVMRGYGSLYYHKKAKRWQLRSRFRFKYFWEIPARLVFLWREWI